uniref:Ty3-gypsy retrotransposon protein n=1 Tax=Gongylonema pulchrum TaxID=637853 RepID=A0A183DD75_9BILA
LREFLNKLFFLAEKKRRWKISRPEYEDSSSSSVVTVRIREHEHVEIHEHGDKKPDDQQHPAVASDFKEDLADMKEKMEELDYEEPMQSSVAEVAQEVKVQLRKRLMKRNEKCSHMNDMQEDKVCFFVIFIIRALFKTYGYAEADPYHVCDQDCSNG